MGEYARDYILGVFGVDIGDDERPIKPKPKKRFGCHCGRMFVSADAKAQHQKDAHGIIAKAEGTTE